MIQEFSYRIVKWMVRKGVIPDKDKGLFSYAVYSLLFGLLPVFIVILLGFLFGMLREGLLMIVPFMLIRKFSGGYHLESPKICVIFSTILLTVAMGFIKIIVRRECMVLLSMLVSLSVICLCVLSPMDNNFRKLTKKERQLFRKIACTLAIISLVGYIAMYKVMSIQYAAAFGVGILLVAMLQILGVVAKASKPKLHV